MLNNLGMDRNVRYLTRKYHIPQEEFEKFSAEEVARLADVARQWYANPLPVVGDYELIKPVLGASVPPNSSGTFLFKYRPQAFECFLRVIDGKEFEEDGKPRHPLVYLGQSTKNYHQAKQRVERCVLPSEKRDPRVEEMIERIYARMGRYASSLTGLRVAGVLSGSFYFGDPSADPDVDFNVIYADESDNPGGILDKIAGRLEADPEIRFDYGICRNLSRVWQLIGEVKEGDYEPFEEDNTAEKTLLPYVSSGILFGQALSFDSCRTDEIQRALEETRKHIDQSAEEDVLLRALLILQMDKMVRYRQQKDRSVYRQQ